MRLLNITTKLLPLALLLAAACTASSPGDDNGAGQDETGNGDGDGDPAEVDYGDCNSACAIAADCGMTELEGCIENCEQVNEFNEFVYGSGCGEATMRSHTCFLVNSCNPELENPCQEEELGTAIACSDSIIPELHARCECGDLGMKDLCMLEVLFIAMGAFMIDGTACLEALPPVWGCEAEVCGSLTCADDPSAEGCECSAVEDARAEVCPGVYGG